ncbi:MAG: hypothetical protein ACJAT7_000062 [Psychromonas sp.]|jgi:hypothetical protein|uniref:hypothetical protein n=1 Tax=Psychromonas sp. TaxID=1884585 RepID=UPI0039E2A665
MKKAVLIIFILLSVGKVNANEICNETAVHDLKDEVRMLRKDVQRLEILILKLSHTVTDSALSEDGNDVWGCYIKDIRAGGIYGTGRTEAEAKGKTLEKCTLENGVCFESGLNCSFNKS